MKKAGTIMALVALGCSDPATSALRGDGGRDALQEDVTAPDLPRADAPAVDAPAVDAPPVDAPPVDAPPVDAPPVDAPAVDAPPMDARVTDVTAPDASPPTDGAAVGPRVVQLGGAYVSTGMQARLDAVYTLLGVTAERLEPADATPERLRNAVVVAAFSARPADWTAARFRPVLDAVRGGAWMLAESFGPWPLHEAGVLSANELFWSRTEPCVGTFFWLQPNRGEESFFAFDGIAPWMPASETLPPTGPVVLSYPMRAGMATIPVFSAVLPTTRARHEYTQYVQGFCEPDVNRHPWCVDNARFCNSDRGANDAWVDEWSVGSGRVFNAAIAPHNTLSLQWGEVTTRLQVNVVREGLRRLGR